MGKRIRLVYTLSDIAKEYVSYNEYKKDKLTLKQFILIMKEVFREISLLIIREKFRFKMPMRLGVVYIRQRSLTDITSEHKKIDYKVYNETGEKVYHKNRHSFGDYFSWHWQKKFVRLCYFTNKKLYSFKAIDDKKNRVLGKRGLSSWIRECSKNPNLKDYQAHQD
jgi:hypothetical protein